MPRVTTLDRVDRLRIGFSVTPPANGVLSVEGATTIGGTLTVTGAQTFSGALDMSNQPITNIGAAGTDFSATGALTLADLLTVTSGGIAVTGASTITGKLTTSVTSSAVVEWKTTGNNAGLRFIDVVDSAGVLYFRGSSDDGSAANTLFTVARSGGSATVAPTTGVFTIVAGLALGTTNLTMTGTISATGARVTQSYHTNITSTNAVTVDSSLLSKVPESIQDYGGDALAMVLGMRVVSYRHLPVLDASNRLKLGVVAESVGEPLALQAVESPFGGSYPGVNLMALHGLEIGAIQQLATRVAALESRLN